MLRKDFIEVIVPMRERLLARAAAMTGNAGCAEDLVQETMLRLWDIHGRLDVRGDNEALAFTILRNKFIDSRRREKVRMRHATAPPEEVAAEETVAGLDDVELIRRIVDALPPLQRQTFRMKEIEGYEASEILEITSCTAEALRQNLSRARRTIREEYMRLTEGRRKR